MERDILDIIVKALFALIFVNALIELIRHRDRPRLESAALLGLLAISVLIEDIQQAADAEFDAGKIIALLLFSQPFLFLRLIGQFQPVPRRPIWISFACMVASWVIVLLSDETPPPIVTVVVVGLFMLVEAYAVAVLVQVTRRSSGIARLRLSAILAGSALVALYILLAGIVLAVPDTEDALRPSALPITIAVAVCLYIGFLPPRRLRRAVQMDELWRYLSVMSGNAGHSQLATTLELASTSATRLLGGKGTVIALGTADGGRFQLRSTPEIEAQLATAGIETIERGPDSPAIERSLRERAPVACSTERPWDDGLTRLAAAFGGARSCLVAPLLFQSAQAGVVIVFLDRLTLFLEDDLEMLRLLAGQAALAIDSSRRFDEARQESASRRALLDLSQALADETDAEAVANRLATDLDTILPSASSGVLLPLP
ncbi:MAG TPA: GAF domain-containing protein, partial [Thermomicrobiales bacterium]|nr:GAF domain-containing protein [Thermomicrobiales bacterium]